MLTLNEIINNQEHRERVIKYLRLPIHLKSTPEKTLADLKFLNEIGVINIDDVVNTVNHDLKIVKELYNEDDLKFEQFIDDMATQIANTPQFIAETNKTQPNLVENYDVITHTSKFYKMDNVNKKYLSLDLVAACWQTVQHITGVEENYVEWISERTELSFPRLSKTIRTRICGKLDQKVIRSYNQNLLLTTMPELIKNTNALYNTELSESQLFAVYADEIIFELTDEQYEAFSLNQKETEEKLMELTGINVHFTTFELLEGDGQTFIKKFKEGYELKMLSPLKEILCMHYEYGVTPNKDIYQCAVGRKPHIMTNDEITELNEQVALCMNNTK